MNGGTSLRPDAVSRPLARSLCVASSIELCYLTGCPRLAAFGGLVGHNAYPARRQSPNSAMMFPATLRRKMSELTAVTVAVALAVAPTVASAQMRGPPV